MPQRREDRARSDPREPPTVAGSLIEKTGPAVRQFPDISSREEYIEKSGPTPNRNVPASLYYVRGYDINIERWRVAIREAVRAGNHCIKSETLGQIPSDLPWPPPRRVVATVPDRASRRRRRAPVRTPPLSFADVDYVVLYGRVSGKEQAQGDSLEDRLIATLETLREQRKVVVCLCWDDVEGDTPFEDREGWQAVEECIASTGADPVVHRIHRFARAVGIGYDKARDLFRRGHALCFMREESSREFLVADMGNLQRERIVLDELHDAAWWLQQIREQLVDSVAGAVKRREWNGGLATWAFHELRPNPRPRTRRKLLAAREHGRRDALAVLGVLRASPSRDTLSRLARDHGYGVRWEKFENYLRSSWLVGLYVVGQQVPVYHDEMKVLEPAERDELLTVLDSIARKSPRPARGESMTQFYKNKHGTTFVISTTEGRFGYGCPRCLRIMDIRTYGSRINDGADLHLCSHCNAGLKVAPDVRDRGRLEAGPILPCPACGVAGVLRLGPHRCHDRVAEFWVYCCNPECMAEIFNRWILTSPELARRHAEILGAIPPDPAFRPRSPLPSTTKPVVNRADRRTPSGQKSFRHLPPPAPHRHARFPEVATGLARWWDKEGGRRFGTTGAFSRAAGIAASAMSRYFHGMDAPKAANAGKLHAVTRLPIFLDIDSIRKSRRKAPYQREDAIVGRHREFALALQAWLQANRLQLGGSVENVAASVGIQYDVFLRYLRGLTFPLGKNRRILRHATGLECLREPPRRNRRNHEGRAGGERDDEGTTSDG